MATDNFRLVEVAAAALSQKLEESYDADAAELSRVLDDSSQLHRYTYMPYAEEAVRGTSAAWKVRRSVLCCTWHEMVPFSLLRASGAALGALVKCFRHAYD